MLTPKEALAKDGRIPVKDGRGRLSREAVARIHELVAEGWQIKGYAIERPAANVTVAKPEVKRVAQPNVKVISDFVIFHDENEYQAINAITKKPVGMREVCNTCRVSLVQCHCGSPTILNDIKVVIKPRTG